MARNSFLLKGWAVTVVGGLLAIGFKEMNCSYLVYVVISLVVLGFFWALDSYYLHQERLFIKLFDHVRLQPEHTIDFCMKTAPFKGDTTWLSCSMSGTLGLFYGGLVVVHLIIILIA